MPGLPAPLRSLMSAAHKPIYAARLRCLVRTITPLLREGDAILDVGCGVGTLGAAIMADPATPKGVRVEGLERAVRGGEPIPVTPYGGGRMPYDDDAFDVVLLADVLHHEPDPDRLLGECARVAHRLLVIKDHQVAGPLAQPRIAFIDWAANAPYGVACLYRYYTPEQWRAILARHAFEVVEAHRSMNLYPPVFNLLFGRRLQCLLALRPGETRTGDRAAE